MRLTILLPIITIIFLTSACSTVKVKEIDVVQKGMYYTINTFSLVPHTEYEQQLTAKFLTHELNKLGWTQYTQDRADETLNVIHVNLTIEDISGVSDTGNVFGKMDTGYVKIGFVIKDQTGGKIKKYVLEANGYVEEFARIRFVRIGASTIKEIANKAMKVVLAYLEEMPNASENKSNKMKDS